MATVRSAVSDAPQITLSCHRCGLPNVCMRHFIDTGNGCADAARECIEVWKPDMTRIIPISVIAADW